MQHARAFICVGLGRAALVAAAGHAGERSALLRSCSLEPGIAASRRRASRCLADRGPSTTRRACGIISGRRSFKSLHIFYSRRFFILARPYISIPEVFLSFSSSPAAIFLRLIPLTQVRLYVVSAARGTGRRV